MNVLHFPCVDLFSFSQAFAIMCKHLACLGLKGPVCWECLGALGMGDLDCPCWRCCECNFHNCADWERSPSAAKLLDEFCAPFPLDGNSTGEGELGL